MKVLVLEDTIEHQVRIENVFEEISRELNLEIKAKVTGKIHEFKEYVESDEVNQLYLSNISNISGYDKKTKDVLYYDGHRSPISRLRVRYLKEILKAKSKKEENKK